MYMDLTRCEKLFSIRVDLRLKQFLNQIVFKLTNTFSSELKQKFQEDCKCQCVSRYAASVRSSVTSVFMFDFVNLCMSSSNLLLHSDV